MSNDNHNLQKKIDEIKKQHEISSQNSSLPRRPSRRPAIPPHLAEKFLNKPVKFKTPSKIVTANGNFSDSSEPLETSNIVEPERTSMQEKPLSRRPVLKISKFDVPPRHIVPMARDPPAAVSKKPLVHQTPDIQGPTIPSESETNVNIKTEDKDIVNYDINTKHQKDLEEKDNHYRSKIAELEAQVEKQNISLRNIEKLKHELELAHTEISLLETATKEQNVEHENKFQEYETIHTKIQRELEQKLELYEEEMSKFENSLNEKNAQISDDFLRIKDLEEQISQFQRTSVSIEEVEQIQIDYESEISRLSERLNSSSEELLAVKRLNDDMKLDIAELEKVEIEIHALRSNLEMEQKIRATRDDELYASEEKLEKLEGTLQEKDDIIAKLQHELELFQDREDELLRESKIRAEEAGLALSQANKNVEELLVIYDSIQAENETLKENIARIGNQKHELSNDLEKEYELEIKRWEEYSRELEADRDGLREELDKIKSSLSRHSARYVSSDQELFEFIETMSQKSNQYRKEIEDLKTKNNQLVADLDKQRLLAIQQPKASYTPDSAYDSSRAVSPTLSSMSKSHSTSREQELQEDLDRLCKSEMKLQEEVNNLLREFDRLSITISNGDAERHKLNKTITELRMEITKLQEKLHAEIAKNLGKKEADEEHVSIANMRREFRKNLEEIRVEFGEYAQKEMNQRLESEKQLRSLKRAQEIQSYSRVSQACQTMKSLTHM